MNRAEVDTYIAQIKVEETRLRAVLPLDPAVPPAVKDAADATLKRTDKMLAHPGLEVLKQGLDNYEQLPPDQKSQIVQSHALWVANAEETLKVLRTLSEAIR